MHAPLRPRIAARTQAVGIGSKRRPRRARRHVHLAPRNRVGHLRGAARDGARARARSGARDLPRACEWPERDSSGARLRRVRARARPRVIVRWGLRELPAVLAELRVERPLLVATERWKDTELGMRPGARWTEVPSARIAEAAALAGDGVVALGGGSAIDLGKAISADAGVPLVSVPTTYAGSEWTTYFGIRDPERKLRGGGAGAHPTGIVYDPELTLDLPRATTVGTAMNAL